MRCALSLVSSQFLSIRYTQMGNEIICECHSYFTQHINEILIPFSLFQLFTNLICIVPTVALLWFLAFEENTLSSSLFTNLQTLPLLGASGSRCAIKKWKMIIWLRSLKIKFMYLKIARTIQQMIMSSLRQIINGPADSPVWRTGACHCLATDDFRRAWLHFRRGRVGVCVQRICAHNTG